MNGMRSIDRHRLTLRLLVADDDRISRRYLLQALQGLGCRPRSASSGLHALRLLSVQHFHALVLDYHLPDMSAIELIEHMRAPSMQATACPPVILLTAGLTPQEQRQLAQHPVQEVLYKPLRIEALQACLHALPRPRLPSQPRYDTAQSRRHLLPLRQLLLEELLDLARQWPELQPCPERLIPHLHRLSASCRLCGAIALGNEARALESRLRQQPVLPDALLQALQQRIRQTIEALQAAVQ